MKRMLNILICLAVFVFLTACASSSKIMVAKSYGAHKLETKTISNVSIEIDPLSPRDMYNYPELFEYNKHEIPSLFTWGDLYYPDDANDQNWCYVFGDDNRTLLAFYVKITNNTPHILRMGDARIYLIQDGEEEPKEAFSNIGNFQVQAVGVTTAGETIAHPISFINRDQTLVHYLSYWENEFSKANPHLIWPYPVGYTSMIVSQNIRKYKLINDVSKEILPDFSYSGLLVFSAFYNPTDLPDLKIVFYDITTKTDAAGNPIEKAKFEFPLKYDKIDMFFDPVIKRWKEGLPPEHEIE